MNDDIRLERLFADGLHDIAPLRAPDGIPMQVKALTSEVRSRPRWLALVRERPMRTNARLAVGSPTVRLAAILVATLLAAVLVIGAAVAGAQLLAADGPLIVDQRGAGHFTTITEAVEAASDGDTIHVRPGTYVEAFVIDKDLTLRGDGPIDEIVITAPDDGPTVVIEERTQHRNPYAILLQDCDSTVSELTIRGEPSAIFASGGAPTVEKLVFDGVGYSYDGVADFAYSNSVAVNRGSAATISGNTIQDGAGIGVFDDATPLIEGNVLSGGGPWIYGFGFGHGARVKDNRIEGPDYYGIGTFGWSSAVEVEGNIITGAGANGITHRAGRATIRGNSIAGAGRAGISADEPADVVANELSDNTIAIVFAGEHGALDENTIRGGRAGIVISMTSTGPVQLTGNVIEGTSGRALALLGGSPVLRHNHLCGNGEDLYIGRGASPDIDDSNEICTVVPAE